VRTADVQLGHRVADVIHRPHVHRRAFPVPAVSAGRVEIDRHDIDRDDGRLVGSVGKRRRPSANPHFDSFMFVFVKRSNSSRLKRQTRPILKAPGTSPLSSIRYNVDRWTWRNSAASPIVTILRSSGVFEPQDTRSISGRRRSKTRRTEFNARSESGRPARRQQSAFCMARSLGAGWRIDAHRNGRTDAKPAYSRIGQIATGTVKDGAF